MQVRRGDFRIDAQFSAPTPGITALFGRSGAGKTSIIHMLAGLLQPAAGSIDLDGSRLFDSVDGVDVPAQARRVSCVFQDLRLFPHRSVAGNLRYGLDRAGAELQRQYAHADKITAMDALVTLGDHGADA